MAGNTPGPDPGNGGRPRKEISKKIVDNLIKIQCTEEEIIATIECDRVTLNNRIREWTNSKMTFSQYFKEKRKAGFVSLRRKQWKLAEKNVAMAIFLGKNYLGQSDVKEIKNSFDPIKVDIKFTKEDEEAYNKRMAEFMGEGLEGE